VRHVWLGARSSFQESIALLPKATFFDRKAKLFNRQVRATVAGSRSPSAHHGPALRPASNRPGERVVIADDRALRGYASEMRDFMVVIQSCVIGGPQPANKADKRANAA